MTLKEARTKARLSQIELGKLINIDAMTISNWENGRTTPRPENWRKLESTLKVKIEFKKGE